MTETEMGRVNLKENGYNLVQRDSLIGIRYWNILYQKKIKGYQR